MRSGQCPASDATQNEIESVCSDWLRPRTLVLCVGSWEDQCWSWSILLLSHSLYVIYLYINEVYCGSYDAGYTNNIFTVILERPNCPQWMVGLH